MRFVELLLAGALAHYGKTWESEPYTGLLLLACFAICFGARGWTLSVVGLVPIVVDLVPRFPRLANHSNLVVLLTAYFATQVGARLISGGRSGNRRWERHAVVLSISVVYFFAAFHKTNTDFLSSDESCFYWYVAKLERVVESAICPVDLLPLAPSPPALLAHEYGMAFLVLFRSTRFFAFILAGVLHATLALGGFVDFSTIMLCLWVGVMPHKSCTVGGKRIQLSRLCCSLSCLIAATQYAGSRVLHLNYDLLTLVHGALFTGFFFFFAYQWWRRVRSGTSSQGKGIPLLAVRKSPLAALGRMWVAPALAMFALMPYIGLSTAGNFTMFSNLMTVQGRDNHLVVPTTQTKVFGFEEDCVEVLEVSNGHRFDFGSDVQFFLVPKTEFLWMLSRWADSEGSFALHYTYAGKEYDLEDFRQSPHLDEYQWWMRYIVFRKIQKHGPNRCYW